MQRIESFFVNQFKEKNLFYPDLLKSDLLRNS